MLNRILQIHRRILRKSRPGHILQPRRARQRALLVAQPRDPEPDHARIEPEQLADRLLRLHRGIEAHQEVLALGVPGLVLLDRLGEEKLAPVGDGAHDAVVREDEGAGDFGDAGGEERVSGPDWE